jgi:hypothetical protein
MAALSSNEVRDALPIIADFSFSFETFARAYNECG